MKVPTAEAMRELGIRLAGLLRAGDLVVLSGELGAGKTTLTRGIGSGMAVRGDVTSPTFVIARVHPPLAGADGSTGPALVHVDAYRLGSLAEVDDLDLDASLADSVTVVEWGEGMVEGLAENRLEIHLERPVGRPVERSGDDEPDDGPEGADGGFDGDQPRTVRFTGVGPRWAGVVLPNSVEVS